MITHVKNTLDVNADDEAVVQDGGLDMGLMVERVQGRWIAAGLTVIRLCGRTPVVFL